MSFSISLYPTLSFDFFGFMLHFYFDAMCNTMKRTLPLAKQKISRTIQMKIANCKYNTNTAFSTTRAAFVSTHQAASNSLMKTVSAIQQQVATPSIRGCGSGCNCSKCVSSSHPVSMIPTLLKHCLFLPFFLSIFHTAMLPIFLPLFTKLDHTFG